jgi:superfamily II DNA or RNA helicase
MPSCYYRAADGAGANLLCYPPMAFDGMRLQVTLRRYQAQILAAALSAEAAGDHRYHLVAPPGAGKTLVGLELARRLGRPAVVFAPTTTIQQQWAAEVRLLCDPGVATDEFASTDPARPSTVTALTYQTLASSRQAAEFLAGAARTAWIEELVRDHAVPDAAAAAARVDRMAAANPARHRTEIARRSRALRRAVLRDEGAGAIERFLHPNALALVDRLAAHGVRTVILDECHHLLDYWAIVLHHLIARLDGGPGDECHVMGLTATLPYPGTPSEAENYALLLGEVDIEIPVPAVVKEGELAPYSDLVAFVEPSPREAAWLDAAHERFADAIARLATDEDFVTWVVGEVVGPALADRAAVAVAPVVVGQVVVGQVVLGEEPDLDAWGDWLRAKPLLSIAALRCLRHLGTAVPAGVPVPDEANAPMGLDDWLLLVERWGLDHLALSADPADHERLDELRDAIAPFGLTLTERGLRQGRSPGDLILALSEAKHAEAAAILAAEHAALGDRLRALVVTDMDRTTTAPARLRDVIDPDAGSARRLHRCLAEHPGARRLDPVLVTGRGVVATSVVAPDLVAWLNVALRRDGHDVWCEAAATDHATVMAVLGHGAAWVPRLYVPLLTAAFAEGLTRCLVGTRALFGEGWNAPSCNTLVDLTSVTTPTSVQQLRGRTIRLDRDWEQKVAHNWDVVCVAGGFERGDTDLARFRRRHEHLWGVAGLTGAADGDELKPVVRGVAHVDEALAADLATRPFSAVDFAGATARSRAQVGDRAAAHRAWGVGRGYANAWQTVTRVGLRGPSLGIRTAATARLAAARARRALRPAAAAGAGLVATGAGALVVADPLVLVAPAAGLAVGAVGALAWGLRRGRALRRAARDAPAADTLGDLARAVLGGLVDAGVVGAAWTPSDVVVRGAAEGSVEIGLAERSGASPADSAALADALRQLLGPIRAPRYLIEREPGVYHPVPDVLGVNRGRADAFVRHWAEHVGGGRLVYTSTDEGRHVLVRARAQRPLDVRDSAFVRWR